MTSSETTPQKDHWVRAIGYGLLAEVATILTIVAVVLFYRYVFARGLGEDVYVAFGQRVGALLGIIGGTIYVFLFARALMRLPPFSLSLTYTLHTHLVKNKDTNKIRRGAAAFDVHYF